MRGKAKRQRVLLADDHELVRRGVRGLLNTKRKWRIVGEAADGLDAVEKTKKLKPEIVILDIDMPNLNGLEATRRIREAVPSAKVIILTLHESGEMVRRALEAGARGLVLKSDLAEGLMTALNEIERTGLFLTPKASEIVMREFLQAENDAREIGRPDMKPTARELEIIRLLSEGRANKEIAATLGITVRTVETHRANVMKKLGLHSLAELIHYSLRNRIHTTGLSGAKC
jgi:DNA-binding NarL/FixJ family response regulator